MVKKFLLFGSAVLVMASCQTLTKTQTARTETITANIASVTVADLDVYPERVSETLEVTPDLRRGGEQSIKHAVEAKALEKNGRGDLLVEPQYVVKKKWTWLGPKIFEISVSGRPASFKNFRALDDSVWTNPIFRGVKEIHHYHNGASAQGSAHSQNASSSAASMEEKPSKPKYDWRPKGFRTFIDVTTPIQLGECNKEYGVGFNILLTLGYQFNKNLFAGVGIGYSQLWTDYKYEYDDYYYGYGYWGKFRETDTYRIKRIPIFARFRTYFCRTRVAPYFDAKLGYEIGCNNPIKEFDVDTSEYGRGFFSPSVGFSIATKKGRNIDFGVTYNLCFSDPDYQDSPAHYIVPSMTVAF